MKKWLLILLVSIAMAHITSNTYNFPKESGTFVDTIAYGDTVYWNFLLATNELQGSFTFQYGVWKVRGDTTIKWHLYTSNDTTFGWFNSYKIDSCTANDSDLVDISDLVDAVNWLRIRAINLGVTGDTSRVKFNLRGAMYR